MKRKKKIFFTILLLSSNCFITIAQTGFSAEQIISTNADGARAIYVADLDNDGDIDVLSASYGDNKIAWYRNNGLGEFGAEQTISISASSAWSVHAADLDNDGDLDVLSASGNDDKIAWYENLGFAGFGDEQIISTNADWANTVYAADLDNDGDMDVLSASGGDSKVAWYENNGSETFGNEQIIADNVTWINDIYAADLDSDGDLDVIAVSPWDDEVLWYENNGQGDFGTQQVISSTADGAASVYAIDLDEDSDVDVVIASQSNSQIVWYRNDGNGNFGNQQVVNTNADGGNAIYASDLDNDGDADILATSGDLDVVAFFENDGNGNFGNAQIISSNANGANAVFTADLDNDGDLDVLSTSEIDDKVAWYDNLITLNILAYENNAPCVGSNTGSLQVQLGGGLTYPPYSYILSDGTNTINGTSTSDDFIIQNLAAGMYSITVTNADSDESIETDIELTAVAGSFFEIVDITSTNSTNEFNNASLQIAVAGGFEPYTYAWSGTNSGSETSLENTYEILNLYAGNYDITVTDVSGNLAEYSTTVLDETILISTCQEPLDIIILNDVSSSVDDTEYDESKQFFVDFINALNIGTSANESRVGIVEWADEQNLTIPITGDISVLQNYMTNNRPFLGGTYPQGALSYGYNYLEAEARPNVPKVLVLSTDAEEGQISSSLIALADSYKAEGYIIVSIAFDDAFSSGFTRSILRDVASLDILAPGAEAYSLLNNDLAETIVNLYVCPFGLGESNTIYFNRDGALEILSYTPNDFCPNPESITLEINVTAQQQLSLPAGTPISFYYNNPNLFSSTPITTYYIPCAVAAGQTETINVTIPVGEAANVWAVLNDNGSQLPPISFPITDIDETIYINNTDNISVCTDPLPTLVATKYTTTPIPICGDIVLYTIDVCNISNLAATGVNITDDAPISFELLSTSINYNSCAAGNLIDGFSLGGGCCVSVTYEYDVSNAPNSFYYNQDVFLSGDNDQIYYDFDGILTSAEDVIVGEINCDSDVVLFSKTPNTTDICGESFVSYTFTIDNQTDVALQNLHFNDVLPSPVIWAAEPYFLNGMSIGTTNITGSQNADFTIAQVEAQTVATFVLDAYLGTWDIFGVLENTATLSDLPNFVGNTLSATAENVNVYATPSIEIPEVITIYDEETATISANIGGGANPIWTTTGSGVLETPNAETTVYVPSQEDIENGFVQFNISTIPTPDFDCGGEEASDSLLLEILPTPIDTVIIEPIDTTITTPTDTTNVSNEIEALIPNAFSPNEDSVNDSFGLVFPTENVSDFYMMIYNRWGNEIFNSNDVNKKWNGNYQNENCEMGIYVYLISFSIDGKRKTYKGNISLIR